MRETRDAARTTRETDGFYTDAAVIYDEGLRGARDLKGRLAPITSQEVAHFCGVSESLVNRWRSQDYRDSPSLVQLLRHPVSFHVALNAALNRRYGFGRAALVRLLEAAGNLAFAAEE